MTELGDTYKHGTRVLRAGQIVKIKGLRGSYKIKHFHNEQGGDVVTVIGPRGESRAVYVTRIGARPRKVETR